MSPFWIRFGFPTAWVRRQLMSCVPFSLPQSVVARPFVDKESDSVKMDAIHTSKLSEIKKQCADQILYKDYVSLYG